MTPDVLLWGVELQPKETWTSPRQAAGVYEIQVDYTMGFTTGSIKLEAVGLPEGVRLIYSYFPEDQKANAAPVFAANAPFCFVFTNASPSPVRLNKVMIFKAGGHTGDTGEVASAPAGVAEVAPP